MRAALSHFFIFPCIIERFKPLTTIAVVHFPQRAIISKGHFLGLLNPNKQSHLVISLFMYVSYGSLKLSLMRNQESIKDNDSALRKRGSQKDSLFV